LRKNWDWLVRRTIDRWKGSLPNLLLASLSLCILWASIWLLAPSFESSGWTALVSPTASPTATRVVVIRQPTPTSFIPTATPQLLIHAVLEGEVLGLIAEEYGTTVEAILEANDIEDVDLISVGQELIIVGAKHTPFPAATRTPSPTPTPTSAFAYGAPTVLRPQDQAVFEGRETSIVLHWASVGILEEEEWYEVRVWARGENDAHRAWTKASNWRVPNSLYPGAIGGAFYWDVAVVYRSGQQVIRLSLRSPTRHFSWR
jgi:LysM repeat protein